MTENIVLEAVRMGDLAQSIVSLARAAEQRRGARIELMEATDTIAKAIRDQLRSGDAVRLEAGLFDKVVFSPPAGLEPRYRAARVKAKAHQNLSWKDVLIRNEEAILGLGEDRGPGQYVDADVPGYFYPATPKDREMFAAEAEPVVKAFTELLRTNAKSHEESAKKAVKHTPR